MNPLTQIRNTQKISAQEVAAGLSENASWHAKYKDSAYVFAGGLGYDLTEGDLLAIFAQYGELMDVNLVRDQTTGKSKGFAFLAYEDQRSTVLAVDNLNGARVASRIIRVDHVGDYKRKKEEDEDERNAAREERGVCYAFQRGECTRGNACRFSHDEQRNSKSWGPKDVPKEQSQSQTDKFRRPKIGEEGQRAGHAFERNDVDTARRGVGSHQPPQGAPMRDGGSEGHVGGGGAELPWEGGLFSMLADKVDTKRSMDRGRTLNGKKDGREEKRKASEEENRKGSLKHVSKRPKLEKEGSRDSGRQVREGESRADKDRNGSTAEQGVSGRNLGGKLKYEREHTGQGEGQQHRRRSDAGRSERRQGIEKEGDEERMCRESYRGNERGHLSIGRETQQRLYKGEVTTSHERRS